VKEPSISQSEDLFAGLFIFIYIYIFHIIYVIIISPDITTILRFLGILGYLFVIIIDGILILCLFGWSVRGMDSDLVHINIDDDKLAAINE
jgi:hypothetical protein